MKHTILWNTIELFFNKQKKEFRSIVPTFNFPEQIFVTTPWVNDILISTTEEEIKLIQQAVFGKIILSIKEKAKTEKLDYLQKVIINSHKCWLIDDGNHICLMLPSEY